jgi:hypothetical protein
MNSDIKNQFFRVNLSVDKMEHEDKTKEQLIDELVELRQRISDLKGEHKRAAGK